VKIHRPFIHVVLSLLLLISQQLGLSHVMTHMDSSHNLLTVNAGQLTASGSDVLEPEDIHLQESLDSNCEQCLVFAQLATVLPVVVSPLPPVLPASFIAGGHEDPSICSQTHCAYLSRAPPFLA
jgi:hypothetical protein